MRETCECGFAREACATNHCLRKQIHLAGLTPGSKWPDGAPIANPLLKLARPETDDKNDLVSKLRWVGAFDINGNLYEQAAEEIKRLRGDLANAPYYHAWLEILELCNKLKEENYRLRNAVPQALDTLEHAFVELTERFQKLPRPPTDRIDMLQYCVGAIRDVRSSSVTRPQRDGSGS